MQELRLLPIFMSTSRLSPTRKAAGRRKSTSSGWNTVMLIGEEKRNPSDGDTDRAHKDHFPGSGGEPI